MHRKLTTQIVINFPCLFLYPLYIVCNCSCNRSGEELQAQHRVGVHKARTWLCVRRGIRLLSNRNSGAEASAQRAVWRSPCLARSASGLCCWRAEHRGSEVAVLWARVLWWSQCHLCHKTNWSRTAVLQTLKLGAVFERHMSCNLK